MNLKVFGAVFKPIIWVFYQILNLVNAIYTRLTWAKTFEFLQRTDLIIGFFLIGVGGYLGAIELQALAEQRRINAWQIVSSGVVGGSGTNASLEYLNEDHYCSDIYDWVGMAKPKHGSKADMSDANDEGSNEYKVDMIQSKEHCLLNKEILAGINLSHKDVKERGDGTYLRYLNLHEAYLPQAKFNYANLEDSNFNSAHLYKAKFDNALLQNAKFKKSQLQSASFVCANLSGANFTGAKLSSTDFRKLGNCEMNMGNLSMFENAWTDSDARPIFSKGEFDEGTELKMHYCDKQDANGNNIVRVFGEDGVPKDCNHVPKPLRVKPWPEKGTPKNTSNP